MENAKINARYIDLFQCKLVEYEYGSREGVNEIIEDLLERENEKEIKILRLEVIRNDEKVEMEMHEFMSELRKSEVLEKWQDE